MGLAACDVGSAGLNVVDDGASGSDDTVPVGPEIGLADLAGQSLSVTVARFLSDYGSGMTNLIASDEILVFESADAFGLSENFTLTLDGEDLEFRDSIATDSTGREWTALRVTFGDASATTGLYSYSYGAGTSPIDSEGVFVAGYETPPDYIAGRAGIAEFSGDWFGYGVLLNGSGQLLATELDGGGTVFLAVDFDAMTVDGSLDGSFASFGDIAVEFEDGVIENGAFAASPRSLCDSGCVSNTTMTGRLYGADAGELSGIIAWDEVREIQAAGGQARLLSAAGFTATD